MGDISNCGGRIGRSRRLLAAGLLALFGVMSGTMGVVMGMPMPAFMGVERVVVACRGFPDGGAAPDCRELGEQARAVLAEGLAARGRGGLPVIVVAPGDEALGDPAALVVTLHATATALAAGMTATAIAVEIRRPGQISDGIPFFQVPPTLIAGRAEDVRSGLRGSLRASLGAGVVEPLAAAPRPR